MTLFTERRSIRRYKDTPIEEEKLNAILEAARFAPSWANTQCVEVVVIKDSDIKKQLSLQVSAKNPATLAVANAPVVLAMIGKLGKAGFYKDQALTNLGDWFLYDLGLASQNICMAAHIQGLGTVIVGAFDHGEVAKTLSVPDGYEVVALIPLGYPDHAPSAPKRKPSEEFIHLDKFGNRPA